VLQVGLYYTDVLHSCMLKDVHHCVLKRIVMGLHGSKMYRNASRKRLSVALEKL